MPNFDMYKTMLGYPKNMTQGQHHKKSSDIILESSWDRDIQSKDCYIYDYYHDGNKDSLYGYDPSKDKNKYYIKAKYIVTQYGTLSKDQVEYHLQFKPSHECGLDYYNNYINDYGMEYPIGLYIDIPDEKGTYRKWMICARDYDLSYVKYSILPCNYIFHWIHEGQIYQMCGVSRSRNSYNSGTWHDYLMTTPENQDQMWLPINKESLTLYYDQRIIISNQKMKKPIAWSVTKIENTHPIGINKITLAQDKFNEATDTLIDGVWYADYSKSSVTPLEDEKKDESSAYISISPEIHSIKALGIPKTFSIFTNSSDGKTLESFNYIVSFYINDTEISYDYLDFKIDNEIFSITISDDLYLGDVLEIHINDSINNCSSIFKLEILAI